MKIIYNIEPKFYNCFNENDKLSKNLRDKYCKGHKLAIKLAQNQLLLVCMCI